MRFPLNAMLVAIITVAFGCASEEYSLRERTGRWKSPVIVALDANHDGDIDAAEMINAPGALLTLDKNKDGRLTYDETRQTNQAERSGEPEPVIQALDANRDDIIDAGEIAGSPTGLKKLDKNRDGQLTPDEYTPLSFIGAGSQRPQAMEKGETEFKPRPGFPQLPTLPTGAAPPP